MIITGDSAGGQLCIVLTLMAIKRGYRVPDGLVPIYPTTINKRDHFTPSLLNAWDDLLLSAAFLNLVMKSYQPTGQYFYMGAHNCYLSPSYASDEDLAQLPPTRLLLAGIDPLRDDGLIFLNRALENKVDIKAVEFKFMPHGFMSMKFPLSQGLDESALAIERSSEILMQLFEIKNDS